MNNYANKTYYSQILELIEERKDELKRIKKKTNKICEDIIDDLEMRSWLNENYEKKICKC